MSERDFDFDLIMGLASGEFPPDEAAEMEAGLDADARRELASQRAALQSLGLLPQPALSTPERRRLRAGVRAELGIAEAPEAVRRPRRRKVRWARAFPALAAAAALVVVIGVARNDDRDSIPMTTTTQAADTTAADAPAVPYDQSGEAATTTQNAVIAATTPRPATTQAAAAVQPVDPEADEATTADAEALVEESRTDAAQPADIPATTTTDAGGAGAGGALPASFDLSSEGLIELAGDEELLASFLDEYAAGAAPFPVSELEARAGPAGLACWEEAAAAEADRVLFAGGGLIDGSEGEAYIIEEDGAAGVRLFNAPDCINLNP